ncbi:hexokinase type 2-like [Littorina saxatilis]|uniref:hexokinase type 2-like n=1 Tax=Littorina saxatilis TaxID=31220 RepID=UPI0038B41EEB
MDILVKQLFGFIADCVRKFVKAHDMLGKKYRVAFVFSFPCKHSSDWSYACLTKWTKEFHCRGFDNKDLRELLQQSLPEDNMACILDVKIVVNDAVGALVAAAYDDPSCKLSLVVGNGFYSCYINEQRGNGTQMEFVKAEMGALSLGDGLARFTTEYDKELDMCSMDPGEQILEKMVSIMYLGEILRLVLVKMSEKGLLFIGNFESSKLKERGSINADDVSLIEKIYIMSGLAALINRMNQPYVTIAADGPSLNIGHPRFYGLMQSRTEELVKPGTEFKLVCLPNASAIGAARVAEALPRPPPTA